MGEGGRGAGLDEWHSPVASQPLPRICPRAAASCAPLLPRLERTPPADLALPLPAAPFPLSRELATSFLPQGLCITFPAPWRFFHFLLGLSSDITYPGWSPLTPEAPS